MANNLSKGEALMRHNLQHVRNQVFELVREETFRLIPRVSLPEKISTIHGQEFVIAVLLQSSVEWWVTSVNCEQNNTCSEKIHNVALVVLSFEDFGCHVGLSTEVSGQKS